MKTPFRFVSGISIQFRKPKYLLENLNGKMVLKAMVCSIRLWHKSTTAVQNFCEDMMILQRFVVKSFNVLESFTAVVLAF